ncbi:MAG: RecX family transcriptional regulator [Rhodospirillaceae bacterium]
MNTPTASRSSIPRPITKARLHNIAIHYLERFSASREGVRRVLERRAYKAQRVHGGDPDQIAAWIAEVLDTLQRQGFLDDARYADNAARSLAARGHSVRAVLSRLAAKGVSRDHIDNALVHLAEEIALPGQDAADIDPDIAAAVAYARRRRLGPWRDPEVRADFRTKDMGALARRGFSSETVRRVLGAADPDEAEDLVNEVR